MEHFCRLHILGWRGRRWHIPRTHLSSVGCCGYGRAVITLHLFAALRTNIQRTLVAVAAKHSQRCLDNKASSALVIPPFLKLRVRYRPPIRWCSILICQATTVSLVHPAFRMSTRREEELIAKVMYRSRRVFLASKSSTFPLLSKYCSANCIRYRSFSCPGEIA